MFDYQKELVVLQAKAADIARAFMEAHPSSGTKRPADILVAAWYGQVAADANAAVARDQIGARLTAVAKRMCAASHGWDQIDSVCMRSPNQVPVYYPVPDGNVIAVGQMAAGAAPLWVHYIGAARDAIRAVDEVAADRA